METVEVGAKIAYDMPMETYKEELARSLAETGAIFFEQSLVLKDGRPTPYFVNMARFNTGRLVLGMGRFFAQMMTAKGLSGRVDVILGPSYKGSAIALATSIALWEEYGRDLPFEYDRKEAKTHGEASKVKSLLVNQTLFDGCRIFVVDDVATSMGTKIELLEKIADEAGARGIACQVTGVGIAVDREQTTAVYDAAGRVVEGRRGADAIAEFEARTGVPVYAVAGIREIVAYLHEQRIPLRINGENRPMDAATKAEFDRYVATYGVTRRP